MNIAAQVPLVDGKPVRVLGVDPGSLNCGWAVVERIGRQLQHVASGVLRPAPSAPLHVRLWVIRDRLATLIAEHRPELFAVEQVYLSEGGRSNVRTALVIGQARGAVLAACGCERSKEALQLVDLPHATVKAAIGAKRKDEVPRAVAALLRLEGLPGADEADALAIAITAAIRRV